jgi:TonB family protein
MRRSILIGLVTVTLGWLVSSAVLSAQQAQQATVQNANILRSIPRLDQAAVDAVRQWQFVPTLLNGVPRAIIFNVAVPVQPSTR